jgi:DNA-binding CsgD family transcriptional regulator
MPIADALRDLAWAATSCGDAAEFRGAAVAWVDRTIGVDAAILMQLECGRVSGATGVGPERPWIDGVIDGLGTRYRGDFDSIMASLASGSFMAGRTTRLERWAALPNRQGLEEDLMFPLGMRIGSGGLIATRGAPNGVLLLARVGRTREFTPDEAALLHSAAPVMSMGLLFHQRLAQRPAQHRPTPPPLPVEPRGFARGSLTVRERTVVEYVVLGLSSREIGLALGTSPNTIRNQVASIFQKLSVASRAELVAVALREGLVSERS